MKRKISILTSGLLLFCITSIIAQSSKGLSVGDTLFEPHPSAIFELRSAEKGFLPTRVSSSERENIYDPAQGLVVYDTTDRQYYYFDEQWKAFGSEVNWLADTSGNLYYLAGKVGIGIDTPGYDLHSKGLFKAEMGGFSFNLDTVLKDLPAQGAFLYKEIDSAQFMASGILDLSQDGGPENIYVIANPEYSDNEDALTQIALMNGTIQLQVDSEQEDKFTLLQMTRDNVLLGCTDFEMDGNKSFLDINKEFLGLSYETDLSFTSVNADSQSVNMFYMDSLSSSDQNSHSLTLSNEGIEMRNGDATDLYQEILFSMDNGWEYRGKDQSSQTFTIRDSSDTELFYLKNDGQAYFDGDVGIGTSSPSEKLHVDGNILASGSITENSDRKLKTDIQTLQNALAKVLSLRGVSYNWKDPEKDSNTQLGLIAQEVEKIYPELVKTDNEGNKHLRYTGLIAPLIEALKELSDENAALRTELESLTENQEGLKAEVELIKEQLLMQGKAK